MRLPVLLTFAELKHQDHFENQLARARHQLTLCHLQYFQQQLRIADPHPHLPHLQHNQRRKPYG